MGRKDDRARTAAPAGSATEWRDIMPLRHAVLAAIALLLLWGDAATAQPAAQAPGAANAPVWTPPKRRRIILMRHGDVAYFDAQGKPVPDPDKVVLTEKGKAQADASGAYLKAIGIKAIDRVISSDLPRTVETAERVLAAAGLPGKPAQIEALREMRNGPTRDIATADLPRELLALVQARVPGEARFLRKESVAELQARIGPALKALLDDRGWDTSLLVLHTLVNNAILSAALTGDSAWYGRFDHGAGCMAIIDVGADFSDAIIKAVNICPEPSPYAPRLKTMELLLGQALKGRQ
jgi:probable phosphoglycerate mutase